MISTLARTSPSAAAIAQRGSEVISLQAGPRSTSRKNSHRNAPVAAEPRPMRRRFLRHAGMWQVSMRARMGRRARHGRRFSGRREVAIGLGVYALYLLAAHRKRGTAGRARALANAARVVALERCLGLHVEPRLQAVLLPHRRLLAVLNLAYVTLNVGLTVGWLMRLYAGLHPEFHRLRRAVALTSLGAQPVFVLFPCAPPRGHEAFVDTIADVSGIDLAYAVVTAAGIAGPSRSRVARRLAPAYPPLVALVVFVTANHYVLDAVAGAALGGAALRVARARRAQVTQCYL